MKNYFLLFLVLLCSACSSNRNINSNSNKRVIYTKTDTIIAKQDSNKIQLFSKNYETVRGLFENSKHGEQLYNAIENKVRISPETLKMLKNENGLQNIFKGILTKENFKKTNGKIPLTFSVMLSLGTLEISEYRITIYTIKFRDLILSDNEIKKLYEFCKKIKFVYYGTEFKDVVVPAGWIFGINQ